MPTSIRETVHRCRGPSLLYIGEDPFSHGRPCHTRHNAPHAVCRTNEAVPLSHSLRPTDFLRIPYVTVPQLLPIHSSPAAGCNNSRPRKTGRFHKEDEPGDGKKSGKRAQLIGRFHPHRTGTKRALRQY